MRLIDADRLFDNLERGVRNTSNQVFREIANTPTVKAIPIEWIEKQMAERENYGDFNTAGAIGYLLLSWEEENEIDRRR